jgi:hypothetical protein
VLLAIVLPFVGIVGVLTKEIIQVITAVRGVLQEYGVSGLVERLPGPLQTLAERALQSELFHSQGGKAAAAVTTFLSATSRAVVEAILMLIAFYFLLTDGHRLVGWLERVAPLPPGRFRSFLAEFRSVSRAVVISTVGTGAVQAVAALVGYLVARVPNAIFFTLVTFFMSFIPAVGAGSVPVVLSIVLFVQGRIGWGIFLVVWGILVVGLIDNVVKPLFIKGEVQARSVACSSPCSEDWRRSGRWASSPDRWWWRSSSPSAARTRTSVPGPADRAQSYQRGAFTAFRKKAVLWPIHSCACFRASSVSIFRRESGVAVVRSSAGIRSSVRSSSWWYRSPEMTTPPVLASFT